MRVAVVCDTFFPNPSVSSIRVTEFCRALINDGYQVDVFYRYYYPVKEDDFYREFGFDVRAQCLSSPRGKNKSMQFASSVKSIIRKVLGNVLVPDLTVKFWQGISERLLKKLSDVDILITSSPSHAIHCMGIQFQNKFPCRHWLADFRDPYLIDSRFKPKGLGLVVRNQHRAYLRLVYEKASLVLHAIPIEHRWARRTYPEFRKKFLLIRNGAPSVLSEFVHAQAIGESGFQNEKQNTRRGSQVYSLATVGYCPIDEARHLCLAVKKLNSSGKQVTLEVAGRAPERLVEEFGKLEYMKFRGQVSHKEALEIIANTDLNISLLDSSRSLSLGLSSKLFEYAYVQKPILSVNPTRSDRLLLRSIGGAKWLHSPSTAAISEAIFELLEESLLRGDNYLSSQSFSRNRENMKFIGALNRLMSAQSMKDSQS